MKKAEAISILATSVRPREAKDRARYDEAVKMAIEALKSSERTAEASQTDHIADSDKKVERDDESAQNVKDGDLIFRQAAIDAIDAILPVEPMKNEYTQGITCGAALAIEYVKQLPSAQPEKRTEERTETHSCDLIDRQAAIEALDGEITVTGRANAEAVRGYANLVCDRIKRLPSAQPDLSSYSDKLWRNAYERGKAEAQAEIIRCRDCKYYREHGYVNGKPKFLPKCTFSSIYVNADDFCSRAERRTDE